MTKTQKVDKTNCDTQKVENKSGFLKKTFKTICLSPVYFFKFCISPLLPHSCIFVPTCSNYMILAVKEFGVLKGFWLGTKRLFRCVPWQKKRGYDPVPINIKGEHLWIL